MMLIFNSLLLSIRVTLRMIVPVIAISLASTVVWAIFGLFTLGLANHVSGPVTAAFISLFGIRQALALKGDTRQTDIRTLALYSVLYGVFFIVVLGALAVFASVVAVLFSLWQLGQPISLSALQDAAKPIQVTFAFLAVGTRIIVASILVAAVYAVMAVPLASAARGAGHGAPSRGLFNGYGQSFLPLFCVFFVSIFLQFFFNFFTLVFALLPIVLSVVSIFLTQSLPDYDLDIIFKGIAACAALLWLHSWIWSVCALALLRFDDRGGARMPNSSPDAESAADIRALRKSRERSF